MGDALTVGITAVLIAGDDTLYGGGGNDDIAGDVFNSVEGTVRSGDDAIRGNGGNDSITGDIDIISSSITEFRAGRDQIDGGEGDDTIVGDYSRNFSSLVDPGADDTIYGGGGDDILYGNGGDDLLFGNGDNDSLFGGAGNDQLFGDSGNDILSGGAGRDSLTGGADADLFFFDSVTDIGKTAATRDVIRDFQQGIDLIDLSAIDALTTTPGVHDAFTWMGTAGHTGAGATLRYANAGGNTYIFGDVDADGVGDFHHRDNRDVHPNGQRFHRRDNRHHQRNEWRGHLAGHKP